MKKKKKKKKTLDVRIKTLQEGKTQVPWQIHIEREKKFLNRN